MFQKKNESVNVWMHFSDLITACLVVFIVITVGLVIKTQSAIIIVEEEGTKITDKFKNQFDHSQGITITDKGAIRFESSNRNEMLFKQNDIVPSQYFQSKLDSVFPFFWETVNSMYQKENKDSILGIKEIRIEGYTDSDSDDYYNYVLSQGRALKVWMYGKQILDKEYGSSTFTDYIIDRIITVGFGETKPLNYEGKLIPKGDPSEDKDKSRRVEISILLEAIKK